MGTSLLVACFMRIKNLTKSDPNPNPNPNPVTEQRTVVSVQLKTIVACLTYPETFKRDNVVVTLLLLSVVSFLFPVTTPPGGFC